MKREGQQLATLPTLDAGITRLETESGERGPLQALVLEQLMTNSGRVCWVDSRGTGTTTSLGRLAPSRRFLSRIDIARGFTAYQHHQLIEDACERARADEVELLVLPAFDYLYRAGDLRDGEARRLIASITPRLAELARETETPILLTQEQEDSLATPLSRLVDRTLTCEQTRFGPRFVGDDHETLVYHDAGGFQTTIAYWERLVSQRYEAVRASTGTGVRANGAN